MARRILLGTPAHDWACDVRYIHSFGMTVKACAGNNVDLRWLFPAGQSLIQQARNELIYEAMTNGFDDLVFIDADQGWTAEWFMRLISLPVDCVGAPIRKKTDDEITYNVKVRGGVDTIIIDHETGLLTAPDMAVGTGFLRLSRHAMQVLWDNSEKYSAPDGRRMAWIFDVRPVNGELVSEDTHVCDKLRAHGIPTWIDPSILPEHYGLKTFKGDFLAWLNAIKDRQALQRAA